MADSPTPTTTDEVPTLQSPRDRPAVTGDATLAYVAHRSREASEWPTIEGYEILGVLGRGGMGVVYKARQVGLDRLVALKMILAGVHADQEELLRFRSEAEAVARIQHSNIIQIYEVGEVVSASGVARPFMALELVAGGSLSQKVNGTPLPACDAAQLVRILAQAMHVAHRQGIIHRDLKPANVLLTDDGTPRITDFGLAKRMDRGQTQTGTVMGTPSYMAPEQAAGRIKEIGPATDVYALGAILYELLTGRPPFRAETTLETMLQVQERDAAPPRLLNAHVDRDLEAICLKCLEKNPSHRYLSASDLAVDLDRYLAGEAISARSINMLDRLARTLDRSQYDVEFHAWGTMLLVFAGLMFVEHLVIFSLTLQGPPYPRIWIHGARLVQFLLIAGVFWHFRGRQIGPSSKAERQLFAIWGGYLVASWIIGLVNRELTATVPELDELTLYPTRAVLAGMAFFAMGGSYWGRCYAFGLAFFILAAVMPWRPSWAPLDPLEFGLLWSTILIDMGLRLRSLGRAQSEKGTS